MLTNTELVEAFIENSLRHKQVLLSNQTFSAESLCDTNQLTSHQNGILLKAKTNQRSTQFYLRKNTPHYRFLQKLLSQHQFLLAQDGQETNAPHFDIYRYFSIKHGYQFNCNTGRALWKNWRAIKRLSANTSKLLVRSAEKNKAQIAWTEVQSIGVSNELIFIETADNKELVHNFEDAILWLNKTT